MKMMVHKIMVWPFSILLLMAFLHAGNRGVLCIGEDGHIEIETKCLPCCNVSDDICVLDELNDLHGEHDDCTNCSDLALDGPLWSKRFTQFSQVQTSKTLLAAFFETAGVNSSAEKVHLPADESPLTFRHNPQSAFIADTILRC